MEYRLQSMYNHMVGRAASVLSPFYSILLDCTINMYGIRYLAKCRSLSEEASVMNSNPKQVAQIGKKSPASLAT